jgi:hypothetical protein
MDDGVDASANLNCSAQAIPTGYLVPVCRLMRMTPQRRNPHDNISRITRQRHKIAGRHILLGVPSGGHRAAE